MWKGTRLSPSLLLLSLYGGGEPGNEAMSYMCAFQILKFKQQSETNSTSFPGCIRQFPQIQAVYRSRLVVVPLPHSNGEDQISAHDGCDFSSC